MSWVAWQTAATLIAAVAAVGSALITWIVYRKSNASTLVAAIERGDAALLGRLGDMEAEHDQRLRLVEADVGTIKAAQQHGIQRRDIESLHHRVTALVKEVSGLDATVRASSLQIERVQSYLMERRP